MSFEGNREAELEIGHVLFIDIVGYSKLSVDDQREVLTELNNTVRTSKAFADAEQAAKLVRLPTGDGMALAFFATPEAPVRCAAELSSALKNLPRIQVRMGIHSGPVSAVKDVNDRSNVA